MSRKVEDPCSEKLDAAIECLVRCLVVRDGQMRESIRGCLVSIGRPSVPALIGVLESDHRRVRWEAAKALGEIGDPRAAAALVGTLGRDYFGVRWLAAEALIRLGLPGLDALISALMRDIDSAFLRDGAHHVLHAIRDQDPSLREVLAPLVESLGTFGGTADIIPQAKAALAAVRDHSKEAQPFRDGDSGLKP